MDLGVWIFCPEDGEHTGGNVIAGQAGRGTIEQFSPMPACPATDIGYHFAADGYRRQHFVEEPFVERQH